MIRARIDNLWHKNAIGIWFLLDDGKKSFIAKPMSLEFEERGESKSAFMLPEPSLEIRADMSIEFLRAFCDAIEENQIIKTKFKEDSRENAALKEHLKDFRNVTDRLFAVIGTKS